MASYISNLKCKVIRKNQNWVYIFLLKRALDSASQWSQTMIGVTINMLCYYYLLLRKYDWEISHKLLQYLRKCCGRLKHFSSLYKKNDGFQNRKSRAAGFAPLRPSCRRCKTWNAATCWWHCLLVSTHHNPTTGALSFIQERW